MQVSTSKDFRNLTGIYKTPNRRKTQDLRPKKSMPEPPKFLSPEALVFWHEIVEDLHSLGLLIRSDKHIVAELCETHAQVNSLTKVLRERGGYTYTKKTGRSITWHTYPEVVLLRLAQIRYMRLLGEVGLTPSARTRVHINPTDDKNDAFADFFTV
jgi:P27 family predicted phage terminase small subunit